MFIKLTSSTGLNEGKPIYVNMDRIVYFREMENPSQKGSFMVDATNEVIKVKETPDEILQRLVYDCILRNIPAPIVPTTFGRYPFDEVTKELDIDITCDSGKNKLKT